MEMTKKYLKIYDDLVKKIQAGVWQVSAMLPSENELSSHYNSSRETIRNALDLLSQNGFIQKVHGKGSIIIDAHKLSLPVSGIVSFKELAENLQLSTQTIVASLNYLEKDHDIYKILSPAAKDRVWQVERVREIANEKVILDKDFFNDKHIPKPSVDVCQDSIYDYIEGELGLTIAFAQKEIVVEEVTEEDQMRLDVDGFTNMVVIKSHVYLEDTSLFQYTESRHRPDKFRLVDFARRLDTRHHPVHEPFLT